MSEIGEEEIAEALWQADSVRATGRRRLTQWSEEGPETHNAWRFMARAVLALLHPALERARREERERLAQVAEGLDLSQPDIKDHSAEYRDGYSDGTDAAQTNIVAAIRKGG